MLTFYSFLWSVFISNIFMLILHFLYKNNKIIVKFDPAILMVLLFFPLFRILVPIEFPKFQHMIGDPYVYAAILNDYAEAGMPLYPRIIFRVIWGIGSIILGMYFLKQMLSFRCIQKRYSKDVSYHVLQKFQTIKNTDKTICLKYLPGIASPILTGLRKPVIYLPSDLSQENNLYYILLHEYTHWKEKDLWLKLAVVILKILFWWNPIVWIIARDVERFIEIRCDKNATAHLDETEKLCYAETMLNIAKRNLGHSKISSALGMSQNLGTLSLKQRFLYLLNSTTTYAKYSLRTLTSLLLAFLVIVLSYYFLVQPSWDTPVEELWDEGTDFGADSSNSYLVEQLDGSYLFYMGDDPPTSAPSEEVKEGLYSDYPIIKADKTQ